MVFKVMHLPLESLATPREHVTHPLQVWELVPYLQEHLSSSSLYTSATVLLGLCIRVLQRHSGEKQGGAYHWIERKIEGGYSPVVIFLKSRLTFSPVLSQKSHHHFFFFLQRVFLFIPIFLSDPRQAVQIRINDAKRSRAMGDNGAFPHQYRSLHSLLFSAHELASSSRLSVHLLRNRPVRFFSLSNHVIIVDEVNFRVSRQVFFSTS